MASLRLPSHEGVLMPHCSCWMCRGYRAEDTQRSAARLHKVGQALRWGWLKDVALRRYDRAVQDRRTYHQHFGHGS